MSRLYPDRPLVGVLAALRRDTKLLLLQRKIGADSGKWGFPGGALELGETFAECAARELREETGITAKARGILTAFDYIDRDESDRVRFHYAAICVLLDWRAGEAELREPEIHSAVGWFSPDEVLAGELATSSHAVELMRLALVSPQ